MADLRITYYATNDEGLPRDPIANETVTTSGTSAQSGVIPMGASLAVFWSDSEHSGTFGANPTATSGAGHFYLPANSIFAYDLTGVNNGTNKFAFVTP